VPAGAKGVGEECVQKRAGSLKRGATKGKFNEGDTKSSKQNGVSRGGREKKEEPTCEKKMRISEKLRHKDDNRGRGRDP